MSFRITEVTLFTTIGDDDEEGLIGMMTPDGWIPFVAADIKRLSFLRDRAQEIATATGRTVTERTFVPSPGDGVMDPVYAP